MNKPELIPGRPLYKQLREIFVGRISAGVWAPGAPLPSERELAEELGVSQGTVRKALDQLESNRLITRHQGLGTFVTVQSSDSALFHFFRVINDNGQRTTPECQELSRTEDAPTKDERKCLNLNIGARIYRVRRLRPLEGLSSLYEIFTVPIERFPGLIEGDRALPNTMYDHYQVAFGVTIRRASEDLKALPAPKIVAKAMGLAVGDPLLRIQRTAYALDGNPVERRTSWLDTADFSYHAEIV